MTLATSVSGYTALVTTLVARGQVLKCDLVVFSSDVNGDVLFLLGQMI